MTTECYKCNTHLPNGNGYQVEDEWYCTVECWEETIKKPEPTDLLCHVPNNPEGKYFLHLFDKYLNKASYSYRKRGRNADRAGLRTQMKKGKIEHRTTRESVALSLSDSFAIYIYSRGTNNVISAKSEYFREKAIRDKERLQRALLNLVKDNNIVTEYMGGDARCLIPLIS